MKTKNIKIINPDKDQSSQKYFTISGQIVAIQQESDYITDEELQKMMTDSSYYGYIESYV